MAEAFGCYKNTIRLLSGHYLNLEDPQPDQFTLSDIAGALSKICRFGGQVNCFYSVAEHSWHCCQVAKGDGLPLETQLAVLLHDAAEAFVGDVVKPLKVMLSDYKAIESNVVAAISKKWQVNFDDPTIEEIDHAMLIAERRFLFTADKVKWTGEDTVRILAPSFECWTPMNAQILFTSLACSLFAELKREP